MMFIKHLPVFYSKCGYKYDLLLQKSFKTPGHTKSFFIDAIFSAYARIKWSELSHVLNLKWPAVCFTESGPCPQLIKVSHCMQIATA